jgi:hypothetical protein
MAFLWPIDFVLNQIPGPFYLLTTCSVSSGHELPHLSVLTLSNLRKCDLSSFVYALADPKSDSEDYQGMKNAQK